MENYKKRQEEAQKQLCELCTREIWNRYNKNFGDKAAAVLGYCIMWAGAITILEDGGCYFPKVRNYKTQAQREAEEIMHDLAAKIRV